MADIITIPQRDEAADLERVALKMLAFDVRVSTDKIVKLSEKIKELVAPCISLASHNGEYSVEIPCEIFGINDKDRLNLLVRVGVFLTECGYFAFIDRGELKTIDDERPLRALVISWSNINHSDVYDEE